MGRYRALLIGASDYEMRGIQPLPFVPGDLVRLGSALRQRNFHDVHVLSRRADGKQVSANYVNGRVIGFLRRARPGDTLLILLSGHGIHASGRDYLVPEDIDEDMHPFASGCVPIDWRQHLDETPAVHVVFLIDACREGIDQDSMGVTGVRQWGKQKIDAALRRKVAYVYACSPAQLSLFVRLHESVPVGVDHGTSPGESFSIFSRSVSDVIARHPSAEVLPLDGFMEAVQDRVTELHRAYGKKGDPQTLRVVTDIPLGEFVFLPGAGPPVPRLPLTAPVATTLQDGSTMSLESAEAPLSPQPFVHRDPQLATAPGQTSKPPQGATSGRRPKVARDAKTTAVFRRLTDGMHIKPPDKVSAGVVRGEERDLSNSATAPFTRLLQALKAGRRPIPRVTLAKAASAALVILLAVGVPTAIASLTDPNERQHDSSGTTVSPSRASNEPSGFDAATTSIVNASSAKGGTLKFIAHNSDEPDTWDPQRIFDEATWDFARYYTRQLVTYRPRPGAAGRELVPDLATSRAKITDAGRSYTYTLRNGITWQDGSAITSQDIKYGIERAWDQGDASPGGLLWLQNALDPEKTYPGPYKDSDPQRLGLKAIKTPDAKTIVFQLPQPYNEFEHLLAGSAATPVSRKHDTRDKYGDRPFSSGPYKFQSYTPGKSLVLVRNEHWLGASDPVRPALPDRIEVSFVKEEKDRDSYLLKGEYDLDFGGTAQVLGFDDQPGLGWSGQLAAWNDPSRKAQLDNPRTGGIGFIALRPTRPLDNVHCRKAILYGADRSAMRTAAGGAYNGDYAPHTLPPGLPGSDPKFDPYGVLERAAKPDSAKAKQELKACGKPGGFSTTLAVFKVPYRGVVVAKAFAASLAKIGVKVEIDEVGAEIADILFSDPQAKDYGLVLAAETPPYPSTRRLLIPLAYSEKSKPNYSRFKDPAVNDLLEAAARASSQGQANQLYSEINQKISEAAVYLPIIYEKNTLWRGRRLTNAYTADAYQGRYDYVSLGVRAG